jgi:hypothetical protein
VSVLDVLSISNTVKMGGGLQPFYYLTRGKSKSDRDVRWLLGKECQVSRIRIKLSFIIY